MNFVYFLQCLEVHLKWIFTLNNKIIDYETQFGDWKTQSTMSINVISSKDSHETPNTHIKYNIEIMMGSETNDIIERTL